MNKISKTIYDEIELYNIETIGITSMNYCDNMRGQMIGWPGGSPADTSPRSNLEPPTLDHLLFVVMAQVMEEAFPCISSILIHCIGMWWSLHHDDGETYF